MPESSDQIVQCAREAMRKQILRCSQKAAQKIAAKMKSGKKLTVEQLANLIAAEFEQLNRSRLRHSGQRGRNILVAGPSTNFTE